MKWEKFLELSAMETGLRVALCEKQVLDTTLVRQGPGPNGPGLLLILVSISGLCTPYSYAAASLGQWDKHSPTREGRTIPSLSFCATQESIREPLREA